jgi:hypothetical protein
VELLSRERITDIDQINAEDLGNDNYFTYIQEAVDKDGKPITERVTIAVSSEIADGIRALQGTYKSQTAQDLENVMRKTNNGFKRIITSLNPFFSLWRNPIRDVQNALLFSKHSMRTFTKNYGRAIKELWNYYRGDKTKCDNFKALQNSGGMYASFFNFEDLMKNQDPKTKVGKLFNKMETLSMCVEMAPRLSEFISSIESNKTVDEAILDSADVTVNFGRSGIWSKWLNSTFMPFFNAKMQGTLKLYRGFSTAFSNQNRARAVGLLVARMAILGVATTLFNNFLYDDDEEYKALRTSDKANNYLIKVGNKFVKLPKGQILAGISSIINRAEEAEQGDETAWNGFWKDINSAFSPVESLRTIFSPIQDVKNNKTWYGGQIESDKFANVYPKDRYDESTSSISIAIGKAINYSPKKINYLLDQYSGIIGDILLPATTKKYQANIIEKNFMVDPITSNKYSTKFYDLVTQETFKASDGDQLAKGKLKYLNKTKTSITELYNAQRELQNSTSTDRENQIKALQVLINNTQKNAITNVKYLEEVLNGFELSEDTFDEDYREATRIAFGAEYALQNYDKRIYEKAQALFTDKSIDYDIYYCVYFDTKEMEGEYDLEGNYITGSRQIQVWKYINGLNISKDKKEALYEAMGYKVK